MASTFRGSPQASWWRGAYLLRGYLALFRPLLITDHELNDAATRARKRSAAARWNTWGTSDQGQSRCNFSSPFPNSSRFPNHWPVNNLSRIFGHPCRIAWHWLLIIYSSCFPASLKRSIAIDYMYTLALDTPGAYCIDQITHSKYFWYSVRERDAMTTICNKFALFILTICKLLSPT